ncbi:MAG: hypothetical protein A2136_10905 [Chloroflexi bacterium RBG_16_54_11]|nr:MAG: hypothetical protein A2136_10905 [Chloroflexi bacterium RBG_16_54_11]
MPKNNNHRQPDDRGKYNSGLNRVIERNLRKMIYLRMKSKRQHSLHERIADAITSASGHMTFVYIHVFWFIGWVVLNSVVLRLRPFDPYPFGLLTMIVSLEAIFLSTFVLISQNRLSRESELRSDLVMHISILSEHELTLALQMLDAIEEKLGINIEKKAELADLETEIKPENVLAEIERLQQNIK